MDKEKIIVVVGFLGAGKTTLLKALTRISIESGWSPYVVLNDYENAYLDAQHFMGELSAESAKALTGSCICCSGISELRRTVNNIRKRKNGITLIEANGTTDACELMEFLGVGIDERFSPPVQLTVVDVKNWQERTEHNALEASQVKVSSLIVLTHTEQATEARRQSVIHALNKLNPYAQVIDKSDVALATLLDLQSPKLRAADALSEKLDHQKAHWASCSVDLPDLPDKTCIANICGALPDSIMRVKGCTRVADQEGYTYFERIPGGDVFIRPYNGVPVTGAKLLTVGPGSDHSVLLDAIEAAL